MDACNASNLLALTIRNQVTGQFRTKITNSSSVAMLETNLIYLMFIVANLRELKLVLLFLVTIIHKFYFT